MQNGLLALLFFCFLMLHNGCKDPVSKTDKVVNTDIEPQNENILQQVSDDGRIVWQKPEEVVDMLGDISDKTIADIGAGSGYFTFRFAFKAKKVIAIDIDPTMIEIVQTFRGQLPSEIEEKIETRLALPNNPMIEDGEADIIVIINTIGYIENRISYLRKLSKGLSENGEIFILDFKAKNIPINAPPLDYRVPLGILERELEESGYAIKSSDDRTLDYQYIVKAYKK